MTLRLKCSVVADVKFELAFMLGQVRAWWDEENLGEFTVTSLKDSHYDVPESQHNRGGAADIRTRHHFDADAQVHHPNILNFARRLQREGLRVILHPDWIPGPPHLHIGIGRREIVERVD